MGRKRASLKNYIWSNLSTIINLIFNFINKTVFIKVLGTTYLGVNSLFTNILGMLSIAELGIGVAISFNLYKPLAENDEVRIQKLINFYKSAYRIIALVIFSMGVVLIPFLPKIAKGAESVEHLALIFCIFIFNSVTSYLITYKSTILSADQKNYIITRISLVVSIVTYSVQIAILLLTKNYIAYLAIASVFTLSKNIYINNYTGVKYPYLKGRNSQKLDKEEKRSIFKDVKAVFYHQVGTVVITQTDSIITSSFINVDTVGFVSNYLMIISVIRGFVGTVFTSMQASIGNIIATTDEEGQYKTFQRLNFLAYWLAFVTSICLLYLTEPFIVIWLGKDFIIDRAVFILLIVNYYIFVNRSPISVTNSSAGLFEPTKFSPIVESIINLVVSIILVNVCGLSGIYIGTLASSFVPVIWLTFSVYKYLFKRSSKSYFITYFLRIALFAITSGALYFLFTLITISNPYLLILVRLIICLTLPNVLLLLIYRRSDEYKYFANILIGFLNKDSFKKIKPLKLVTYIIERSAK